MLLRLGRAQGSNGPVLSSWACSGTVLTNPVFLGDRAARMARMRRAGMCVGLGTDGGLDNNTLSIFHEMKLAALVQKSVEADPQAISAADPGYRRGRAHRGAAARLPRTRTARRLHRYRPVRPAVKERRLCGLEEAELRRRVVASTRRFLEAK